MEVGYDAAEVQLQGLVDKKNAVSEPTPFCAVAALPSPKRGAAAAMMLMVPRAPYNLCLPHRAPFTARLIAIGVVHHRRAAAVGASDNDAEELLTLVKD